VPFDKEISKQNYAQKLKDPRWQKKRLNILNRDQWTCQKCGDSTKTLNVHHRGYVRGKEPWEYDDWMLSTLCEPCHREEPEDMESSLADLTEAINSSMMTSFEIGWLSHLVWVSYQYKSFSEIRSAYINSVRARMGARSNG